MDAAHWDGLLAHSATDVPFLRHGYLSRWWDLRGGGEWPPDAQLCLLAGYAHAELKGIAPLFSVNQDGIEKALLLGSVEISDYLDFIASPDDLPDFISSALAFLSASPDCSPASLELVNIPAQSPTNALLKELAGQSGWSAEIANAYHTPAIALAADWDTYLAGIDKKQRHEIRRKMRRAAENTEVAWYFVTDAHALDAEIEAFFNLMALDEAKQRFLTGAMRSQLHAIIHWAFDAGYLQLSFMTINNQKAAAYLCFDYNGHILVYNSGFDYQFSSYSPGWVLLGHLIQHAIQTGSRYFDFMRGDEDYKYRFGAADGFVTRALLKKI